MVKMPEDIFSRDAIQIKYSTVLLDFSLTVKAAPHECVIRTGLPKT